MGYSLSDSRVIRVRGCLYHHGEQSVATLTKTFNRLNPPILVDGSIGPCVSEDEIQRVLDFLVDKGLATTRVAGEYNAKAEELYSLTYEEFVRLRELKSKTKERKQ